MKSILTSMDCCYCKWGLEYHQVKFLLAQFCDHNLILFSLRLFHTCMELGRFCGFPWIHWKYQSRPQLNMAEWNITTSIAIPNNMLDFLQFQLCIMGQSNTTILCRFLSPKFGIYISLHPLWIPCDFTPCQKLPLQCNQCRRCHGNHNRSFENLVEK